MKINGTPMSDQNNTKICIGCLQAKPLTSFLQMTSAKGGVIYGNMCSACRKANMERLKNTEREDSTRSSSGFKIDAKAKVAGDTDKANLKQEKDELYHEERDEEQELQIKQTEELEKRAGEERDYREEKKAKETKVAKDEGRLLTPAEERAARDARIDLSVSTVDIAQPLAKFTQSATFNSFKTFLGGSSPLVKYTERMEARLAAQANAEAKAEVTKETPVKTQDEPAKAKENVSKETVNKSPNENTTNQAQKQTNKLFENKTPVRDQVKENQAQVNQAQQAQQAQTAQQTQVKQAQVAQQARIQQAQRLQQQRLQQTQSQQPQPAKQIPTKNLFGTINKAAEVRKLTDPVEFAKETNNPTSPGSRRR